MKVSSRLIFGEKFGVFEFTYVVIVGARPCEKGVFAYRRGATFSQSRKRDRVIERSGSRIDKSLDKRRFMVRKFRQTVVSKRGKDFFEKRQPESHEYNRQKPRSETVDKIVRPLYRDGIYVEKQTGTDYGDCNRQAENQNLESRALSVDEINRHITRDKSDDERRV